MSCNPDNQLRVIFDSDVMFDPFRRYMLLSLVLGGAFQTVWSAELIREWSYVIIRDPNDQHVATCALVAAPCVLLTYNRRHFHVEALRERSVDLYKPGQWLSEAFRRAPSERSTIGSLRSRDTEPACATLPLRSGTTWHVRRPET